MELPGRYTAKMLYGWNDKKFEEEYLKKLERNWNRWKKRKKENKEEYKEKLEESLEWNERDEQRSRIICVIGRFGQEQFLFSFSFIF